MDWDASSFIHAVEEFSDKLKVNKTAAVTEGAVVIMELSESKTPVETGNLRGSTELKRRSANSVYVYVPGPYARYQHYGLDFRHETGQALFLESALMEGAEAAFAAMAARLQ